MDKGESSRRHLVRQPVVTQTTEPRQGVSHEAAIAIVDGQTGQVAREFTARHPNPLRRAYQQLTSQCFGCEKRLHDWSRLALKNPGLPLWRYV